MHTIKAVMAATCKVSNGEKSAGMAPKIHCATVRGSPAPDFFLSAYFRLFFRVLSCADRKIWI